MLNLRKLDLKLVFCYISLCTFYENCIEHICYSSKSKTKQTVGLYDIGPNFEKNRLNLVFCYIRSCNFFKKLLITHLLLSKMQNKNIYGFV